MVQIPLRRAHRLRAIILASPIKKLRPQPTERTPTAWHTNEEYINAEASEEASASSAVANVSENRVLPIATPPISDTNPAFITVFLSVVLIATAASQPGLEGSHTLPDRLIEQTTPLSAISRWN